MKGYVRIILVVTLLLLSTALLAALNVTGLWNPKFSWQVVGKTGPSIIAGSGGNIIFLSKDGAAYELTTTGTLKSLGQTSGITNIVAPAAYVTANSENFLVYVTAQGTEKNKLVVQKLDEANPNGVLREISSSAYGVVAYAGTGNPGSKQINIYTATMDGTLYYARFDTTSDGFDATVTANLSGPVKIPPLLSPAKDKLYVLTQYGDLYSIETGTIPPNPDPLKKYAGEFTVPMAMDETGYIYALNTNGRLYKIDPADGSEKHAEPLLGSDSSGVLIDGDGFIYVFGGKKVAVLNSNLLKLGEYSIGQSITTTPAIVKDSAGKTYVIVPSSESSSSGKITILSFDRVSGSLTKEWEYVVPSSFPISAAVDVAPTNELTNYYYFATATNDGTVYAWKFDGNGPYGIWACYGQNSNHTGFIDSTASTLAKKIYLMAYEGFASRPLSSTSMGSYYGLLYDATIVNADGSTGRSYKQLRTNEPDKTKVPEGVPGSQKLEILFDTPTTATLLFTPAFTPKKGTLPVTEDATFSFARWQTGTNGYEGSNLTSKLATLTYRFSDRTVNLLTNATYTYYTYHKYSGAGEASKTDGTFNYNDPEYIRDPSKAKITISASPIQQGKKWFPFKWVVYQWNPDNPNNYDKQTLGALDSLDLELKGPAYIEIYYAQLSATITLLVPDFAYGRTPAYIFLDAAPNSIAYTMEATMLNGVTIEKVVGEEYAESLKKVQRSVTSDHIKYVFNGMEGRLTEETRVATLAVNLLFPNKVDFSGGSTGLFEQYVNLYGYAQLQGQLIDSQGLMAKKVYSTNHYLYVLGDFNEDFYVDINDWNFFVEKYGTTVSGTDVIYNIGPRDEFIPPYPDYKDYRAGYLTDSTNAVNEEDLYVFASMFGFAVQEADRVKVQ